MTNRFFENFPTIDYNGISLKNLMVKSKVIADILAQVEVMHPFVVNDGERADTVAYDYYGDSELYWLVYMSNSIVDPYYDWPMTQSEFRDYILLKYGSFEIALQTIVYWSNPNFDYYMSPETKSILTGSEIEGWIYPVYAFDIENELNENKRNIKLIDVSYVSQIIAEIEKIYG